MKEKTVLIVDDIVENLDIMETILDEYDIIDATNGKDALAIANNEKIDLILLDIVMPLMNGFEVCKQLKKNEKTRGIPVIFITAKTDENSIAMAYDVGGADYVTKPFHPKELKARVKTQLKFRVLLEKEHKEKRKLQTRVELTLGDLHYAQGIAKIGFWQYNTANDFFCVDDEFYNIFEIDKNLHPIKTLQGFLDAVQFDSFHSSKEAYQIECDDKHSLKIVVHKIITAKGNVKYIEKRCVTRQEANSSLLYTGTIQDVTQQHKTNETLIAKERVMLHQSRLAQMGEMVAMIAHQWRQPLNAISLTVDNLQIKHLTDNLDTKTLQDGLKYISNYSQYLSHTIDDFRGFFKEDKTKEITSIAKMVQETLSIVEISLKNQNIKVTLDVVCDIQFKTYKNEVKQVILNLIKNAEDVLIERKVQDPRIVLRVSCDQNSDRAILTVEDNAGGISLDISSQIFKPYFSTKKDKNGTGLGLYMSKIIINDHCGGDISVSNTSVGAAFKIEFDL